MKPSRANFWLVYVDAQGIPDKPYFSEESARQEAERLSYKLQKDVFILEATHVIRVTEPVVNPYIWQRTEATHDNIDSRAVAMDSLSVDGMPLS